MNASPRNAKPHGGNRGAYRTSTFAGCDSTPADARLLLSRLEGVRGAGRGWRACCPAHGSRGDSLSIAESDSGRVLLRCHAGCSAAAIVEAVGLRLSDLCPAREPGRIDPLAQAQAAGLVASAKCRREAEELQRWKAAASIASERWEAAKTADASHPYLRAKCIDTYGLRQECHRPSDALLLVPMRDGDGTLWNVQSIDALGRKLFLAGGRKRGLWHLLGDVTGTLCIAEGYATAASVRAATGHPVAVAFDAGNLEPVARSLRALHPSVRIIVCADDDADTAERMGRNPGLSSATAAACAVQGSVARPVFGGAR